MKKILTAFLVIFITVAVAACGGSTSSADIQKVNAKATKLIHTASTTVASDYQNAVQELYVAYFGRPADASGLTNFENALLSAHAPTDIQGLNAAYNTSPALQSLMNNFGTSAESQALYGNGNTAAFVSAIYQNVLGRTPVPNDPGAAWWTAQITSGALTKGNAALSIMAGALVNTSAQGILDGQLINNRIATASYFTAQLNSNPNFAAAYSGNPAAAAARAMLNGVISTTDTTAYQTTVNAVIAALPGATPLPTVSMSLSQSSLNAGQTTTLTWTVANVTLCTATDHLTGTTTGSGTTTITAPTAAGTYIYGLSCTGPGGTATSSVTLTVTASAVTLMSITITPSTSSIAVGATNQLLATGYYSDSSTQNLTSSVTWSTGNNSIETVSASGLLTGVATGSTTVSATLGSISGSATETVIPAGLACGGANGSGTDGISLHDPQNLFTYSLSNTIANGTALASMTWGALYSYNSYTGAYTGTLKATLWASFTSFSGGTIYGYRLGDAPPSFVGSGAYSTSQLIAGGSSYSISDNWTAKNPPPGQYCMVITLEEYSPPQCASSGNFCTVDWAQFTNPVQFQ